MGQRANGLLYGCEAPELPNDEDGEAAYDLVMRWEKATKVPYASRDILRVRVESEGGKKLLGVWIAVGGSGEDGVPYFLEACLPLDKVELVYAEHISKAAKLWQRFVVHAQKEKIFLPSPSLWLTPCETA